MTLALTMTRTMPTFVVRVAGSPMAVLDGLRCAATAAAVADMLERRDLLVGRGERISELLHAAVSTVEHRQTRSRILSLRRDIYNGRLPRPRDIDTEVRAALPGDVVAVVDGWLTELGVVHAAEERLEAVVAADTERARAWLRRGGADPLFRCGLVVASPDFHADLAMWLARPDRPDLHLENTLVKYLARAAAKTSPFSTLTSTGYGRWTPGLSRVEHNRTWSRRSVIELNLLVTRALVAAVGSMPEAAPALVVRMNPALVDDGDSLCFVVPHRNDSVVTVGASATVRCVIDAVDGCQGRLRSDVVRSLAALDGIGREGQISVFLDRLTAIGLLEVRLPICDQSTDPLGELEVVLRDHGGPACESLRDSVRSLRDQLRDYARHATPAERSVSAVRIGGIARAVARDTAVPEALTATRNIFYEDTITDTDVRVPVAVWESVREDVALLHELAGLYDMAMPASLAANEYFVANYGPGATRDLVSFFRDLSVAGEPPASPRLGAITALQQRLAAEVVRHPVGADGVRSLDHAVVRAVLNDWPSYLAAPRVLTLHCQLLDAASPGRQARIVLNDLYRGRSRSLARQVRLASDGVLLADVDPPPDGPVYADVTGAAGANLELRAPLTPWEITYPGGLSGRPADRRIPLGELDATHDRDSDRLRLVHRRTGRGVVPQHLGTTAVFLLPPVNRFLLDVFGEASYVYLRQGLSGLVWRARTNDVEHVPRLCIGRVVVNRAKWVTSRQSIPQRRDRPAKHLMELTRWRCHHGIPERCFVRAVDPGSKDRASIVGKARKPVYVDLTSPLFLPVLDELTSRRDALVMFEELLPGPEDAVLTGPGGGYATELVIESVAGRDAGR